MKFWDSSAILPLLVGEPTTDAMRTLAREDGSMLVSWATPVECLSALARVEREGHIAAEAITSVIQRLDALADGWHEVQPVEEVRRTARRLLRDHQLRAADALQLSAAIVAAEGQPDTLDVVTLDARLAAAAGHEGFTVRGG